MIRVRVSRFFFRIPTASGPKTPGINTDRLFELVQKINMPRNCRSSGKFVLNSTSKHKPISYEIRLSHPTRADTRSIPYIHPTNDTAKPSHCEHAAPAAISRHERHEPIYKIWSKNSCVRASVGFVKMWSGVSISTN